MEPLDIDCKNLSLTFHRFEKGDFWRLTRYGIAPTNGYNALSDVTFDVPKGQFLGFLGRNGAGKSTLLRTIGGIYHANSGVVHLNDAVSGLYELGVTGDNFMTGRQFAIRWLSLNDMSKVDINYAIDDLYNFTELGDYFDKIINSYSMGMKARLFFGVATAVQHKIFLIDEVLSVGDIYFTAKCWGRLRNLISNGATGLLATHDWTSILKLCDNACIIEGGKIIDYGEAREVVQRYLNMPKPNYSLAKFSSGIPDEIEVETGQDLELIIPFKSTIAENIYFGFSIEQFNKEVGWEHVLHLDPSKVSSDKGDYRVLLSVKSLPLAPGNYVINLFLNLGASGKDESKSCDSRGWLYGNPILLKVTGEWSNKGNYIIPTGWKLAQR